MLQALRLFWLVLLFVGGQSAQAFQWHSHTQQSQANIVGSITVDELPQEARATLQAIKRGGPYAYDRDGVVFGNFERILPKQSRGYYHEYTVKTPGVRSRGARRIISGKASEYYYTNDHYQTFKRIRE